MRAAYLATPSADDPASALEVAEIDAPSAPDGWALVDVQAAALNMHDVWVLRGVAPAPANGPAVIGSDGAGICDGLDVIVYPVLELPDPGQNVAHGTLVSDLGHGTFAEQVSVPRDHLVPKPGHLSWEEAAALPTAWLTAYRMLFTKAGLGAGQTVLVQGAGGGVATAAIALATAAGATVMVTSRSAEKRERALAAGAAVALESNARVPELADVVVETVGPATFEHSVASTRRGGHVVCCGASTGFVANLNLARLFAREINVHGSTTGTLEEFRELVAFVDRHRLRPAVDSVVDLDDAATQVKRMVDGDAFGKLCLSIR